SGPCAGGGPPWPPRPPPGSTRPVPDREWACGPAPALPAPPPPGPPGTRSPMKPTPAPQTQGAPAPSRGEAGARDRLGDAGPAPTQDAATGSRLGVATGETSRAVPEKYDARLRDHASRRAGGRLAVAGPPRWAAGPAQG